MPRLRTNESTEDRFCRIYHERLTGRMSYREATIEDVAEILGVTVQTARRKIRNIPTLTVAEMQTLNRAFDLDVAVVDRMEGVKK